MRLARLSDGLHRVPGSELEYVMFEDGRALAVLSTPAYLETDGTLVPGRLESFVRTELHRYRYPGEPIRFGPLVCENCGDNGQSTERNGWPCEACHGYGHEKNLHLCAWCGEFSTDVLPCAPRQILNHELLLERMHSGCAVESTVAHVNRPALEERGALVGLGAA